jgi:1,4-dihydroxy-2-naphthoate polyprenyltransferase
MTAMTRPGPVGVWISAARPATLLACVVPVVVGVGLAAAQGEVHPFLTAVILLSSGFIQIGTNLYNDYADFKRGADTEDRLGPARATQRGWLSPRAVANGAKVSFALAVLFGGILVYEAGWPVLAIGLSGVLCGVAYTGGPYPLAYNGLGEVFVFLFFGVAAVVGTVFILTGGVTVAAGVAAVAIGLLATAILVVNNLRDRHTDRLAGKRTLAVRLGATGTRVEYTAVVLGAYALVAAAPLLGVGTWYWLLAWLSLPLAVWEIRALWGKDGAALNPHLGGAARLELLFGVLLAAGVAL